MLAAVFVFLSTALSTVLSILIIWTYHAQVWVRYRIQKVWRHSWSWARCESEAWTWHLTTEYWVRFYNLGPRCHKTYTLSASVPYTNLIVLCTRMLRMLSNTISLYLTSHVTGIWHFVWQRRGAAVFKFRRELFGEFITKEKNRKKCLVLALFIEHIVHCSPRWGSVGIVVFHPNSREPS